MKSFLPLAALLLLTGARSNLADTVELNGITSLFGEKTAFLVLHLPGQSHPVSFVLSEGGSEFGIKLLGLDVANHRATIELFGETQNLRLCSAPDLEMSRASVMQPDSPPSLPKLTPQEQLKIARFLENDQDVQSIRTGRLLPANIQSPHGTPGSSPSETPAPTGPSGSPIDPTSPGNSANPSADTSVSTSNPSRRAAPATDSAPDYTSQYWYVTSLNIERNRLATANEVLGGEAEPLPQTPLTPPQTPAALVGRDTYFPNHIRGFVYTGSVDD